MLHDTTQDAPAPDSPVAKLSLEDRLRTMIISHNQHHQSQRASHDLPLPPSPMALPQQTQLPFPQPTVGPALGPAPQFIQNVGPAPQYNQNPGPAPQYNQNTFVGNPPLPIPFPPVPPHLRHLPPQQFPPQHLPPPHLRHGPASYPTPSAQVPGFGPQVPGSPTGAPVPRSPMGPPRFTPNHPQPSPARTFQRPGHQQSYGPRGPRFSPRAPPGLSAAPPPSSLDHFPPLGKELPRDKPRSPAQPADQARGQHNPNARLWQPPPPAPRYEQFFAEQALHLDQLANTLLNEITPPEEDLSSRRKLLEDLGRICQQLSPTAKLVPFGSLVTGFATASSDIDCVFTPGPEMATEEALEELPSLLEKKLQDEGFEAKLLSRTRVPIIKMVQKPTAEYPQEIHCDIGFNNHLAIHNTQLLVSYSNCDERLKQMVLFIKWWAKKRHINSPYRGTLSSYGYVLMILHYLINIVQPPVLPNLQLQQIPEGTDDGQIHHIDGENIYNIWFSKDTKRIHPSLNKSSLGELLRGFFDYYSYKFAWGQSVISIRTEGGILSKQDKGWIGAKSRPANTADGTEKWEVKDRYLFALEDPFETAHNVGRTCNLPGVARIRDELRRAMMLIKIRGDRGRKLAQFLCEEAPPDRPFVRRENRDKDQQESKDPNAPDSPAAAADGAATEEKLIEAPDSPAIADEMATEDKATDPGKVASGEELAAAETAVPIGNPETPNSEESQG